MKRYLLVIPIVLLIVGCTNHYYKMDQGSVNFYLQKPGVERVYFLSSLDGYKPHKADRIGYGRWRITVPGNSEFNYFYNVDGNVYLPFCPLQEYDDFGSRNCLYVPGM